MYQIKKTIPIIMVPQRGSFGHSSPSVNIIRWYHCREVFHRYWGVRDRDLYFSHGSNKGKAIATFMREVETRLGIKTPSDFGPTQSSNISWGNVSPWWTTSKIKKWFFTVLIRAGANYSLKSKDFNAALYSIPYTKDTEAAVKRFFNGYNRYTGTAVGWYSAFCYSSPKVVRTLLIK